VVLANEQMVGLRIVRKSLEGPIRQIAYNAGKDGSEIISQLRGKGDTFGYNAKTDKFEDLFSAGVIDPTKVVRNALEAASSITGMVITTEGLVADFDDEKDEKNPTIII